MSIVTAVAVHLAANPDAELTSRYIGQRWGINPANVARSLQYAETKGWVKSTIRPNPAMATKQIKFYTAGERLLKEIGRWNLEPESPEAATSKAAIPRPPSAAQNSDAKPTPGQA